MHGEDSQRSNVVKQSKTYIGAGLSVFQLPYEPYRTVALYSPSYAQLVEIFHSVHTFSIAILFPLTPSQTHTQRFLTTVPYVWRIHVAPYSVTSWKESTVAPSIELFECVRRQQQQQYGVAMLIMSVV